MTDITLWQLITAYLFIIILIFIVRFRKISREKEIIISSIRMTVQLVLVGYVLTYVFHHSHPIYTVVILLIMECFAIVNIFRRMKNPVSKPLKKVVAYSMFTGTVLSLIYFDFIVVHFTPWFEPRYFIPIGGMIIGNSMTGISLGLHSLLDGMKSKKALIESALMLGATPRMATHDVVNQAFDAAILPTINSMIGMGIVFLPGMMTGVILSGADPLVAIKYQIAIMLGITGAVSLSVILFLHFGYKTFFNKKAQFE
jgi:putative ABC transport system permease protein